MSLFNLGKRKDETKKPACACNDACSTGESICCIKVLGSGCKSCHALLESTKEAVTAMKLPIEVEYITDLQKIMEYGVMSMPALVVNEDVVSMGKVVNSGDIEKLLRKSGFLG